MKRTDPTTLYGCLVAAQAAGSQGILWTCIPVYRQLVTEQGADVAWTVLTRVLPALLTMQVAYWAAFRLRPRVAFRRHVVLGHLSWALGEMSLFFASALATYIVIENYGQLQFVPWKMATMTLMLFATCCYKYQLQSLGETLMKAEDGARP